MDKRIHSQCPNCNALYQVVWQKAGAEAVDRQITCGACGAPLPGREGKFVLKYFFLRNAVRRQRWRKTKRTIGVSSRAGSTDPR